MHCLAFLIYIDVPFMTNNCVHVCFPHQKKPPTTDLSHFTVDEWELPKDEFTLLEELGSGYFADVYRGRWKNHINVAIKILKSGICSSL